MENKGVLLPISALYTPYGIGDLGPAAYRFADFLATHDQAYWQILPVSYCGYGNSPYNPLSSLLGNPYLISPELLLQKGLISTHDLAKAALPSYGNIDYAQVYQSKDAMFDIAVLNYLKHHDILPYIDQHSEDVKPVMAFLTLQHIYGNSAWYTWEEKHHHYNEELYQKLLSSHRFTMLRTAVLQEIFESQITDLRAYLKELSITLIGDIPLYVASESADVWANQEYFSLTEQGERIMVAGVPPDAFSDEGQLWGNPIYLWDKMREHNYEWFVHRIGKTMQDFDLLRLDHFIGYVNYWQIPATELTAIDGAWIDGPGAELFDVLCAKYGKDVFIAEDLGILSDKVCQVRDSFGFPGMIILQFCYDDQIPETEYFPHNKLIYTGTHDNQTTRGWYCELLENKPDAIRNLMDYFRKHKLIQQAEELTEHNISLLLIESAYASPCKIAIIPFQDILALDDDARCNIPGTALGNWEWRMQDTDYAAPAIQQWSSLNKRYNRG